MFEEICTGFLENEGYSVEEFYEEVQATKAAGGEGDEEKDADEVVNVIYMVVDFPSWAEEMYKQAKHRKSMAANSNHAVIA